MKAIKVHQFGGPEVLNLEDCPIKSPGFGQAKIKMKCVGVNFVDIYIRRGAYSPSAELPYIPGKEGAGIVESVGQGVTHVKPGDKVAFTGQSSVYAEECVVEADSLIPVPQSFSFEQAAAFPLQGMTAHYLLHEFRQIKPGDVVLIHAAAGGMGLLLVQWARKLGARVIGTVSSLEKAQAAKAAGAEDLIIYTEQDFVAEVMRLTGKHGADLIIDGVGKTTFKGDLEACALRGNIVVYGSASGPPEPFSPTALMPRALTLSGGSLQNFLLNRKELLRRAEAVIAGIHEGWLKLRIDRVLPLAQAAEAHNLLENRQTIGKVLLTLEK